jgi:hypothetical protein
LRGRAYEVARQVPWQRGATPTGLAAAGLSDARPGMVSVLDVYISTQPRVLVLVASSTDPE